MFSLKLWGLFLILCAVVLCTPNEEQEETENREEVLVEYYYVLFPKKEQRPYIPSVLVPFMAPSPHREALAFFLPEPLAIWTQEHNPFVELDAEPPFDVSRFPVIPLENLPPINREVARKIQQKVNDAVRTSTATPIVVTTEETIQPEPSTTTVRPIRRERNRMTYTSSQLDMEPMRTQPKYRTRAASLFTQPPIYDFDRHQGTVAPRQYGVRTMKRTERVQTDERMEDIDQNEEEGEEENQRENAYQIETQGKNQAEMQREQQTERNEDMERPKQREEPKREKTVRSYRNRSQTVATEEPKQETEEKVVRKMEKKVKKTKRIIRKKRPALLVRQITTALPYDSKLFPNLPPPKVQEPKKTVEERNSAEEKEKVKETEKEEPQEVEDKKKTHKKKRKTKKKHGKKGQKKNVDSTKMDVQKTTPIQPYPSIHELKVPVNAPVAKPLKHTAKTKKFFGVFENKFMTEYERAEQLEDIAVPKDERRQKIPKGESRPRVPEYKGVQPPPAFFNPELRGQVWTVNEKTWTAPKPSPHRHLPTRKVNDISARTRNGAMIVTSQNKPAVLKASTFLWSEVPRQLEEQMEAKTTSVPLTSTTTARTTEPSDDSEFDAPERLERREMPQYVRRPQKSMGRQGMTNNGISRDIQREIQEVEQREVRQEDTERESMTPENMNASQKSEIGEIDQQERKEEMPERGGIQETVPQRTEVQKQVSETETDSDDDEYDTESGQMTDSEKQGAPEGPENRERQEPLVSSVRGEEQGKTMQPDTDVRVDEYARNEETTTTPSPTTTVTRSTEATQQPDITQGQVAVLGNPIESEMVSELIGALPKVPPSSAAEEYDEYKEDVDDLLNVLSATSRTASNKREGGSRQMQPLGETLPTDSEEMRSAKKKYAHQPATEFKRRAMAAPTLSIDKDNTSGEFGGKNMIGRQMLEIKTEQPSETTLTTQTIQTVPTTSTSTPSMTTTPTPPAIRILPVGYTPPTQSAMQNHLQYSNGNTVTPGISSQRVQSIVSPAIPFAPPVAPVAAMPKRTPMDAPQTQVTLSVPAAPVGFPTTVGVPQNGFVQVPVQQFQEMMQRAQMGQATPSRTAAGTVQAVIPVSESVNQEGNYLVRTKVNEYVVKGKVPENLSELDKQASAVVQRQEHQQQQQQQMQQMQQMQQQQHVAPMMQLPGAQMSQQQLLQQFQQMQAMQNLARLQGMAQFPQQTFPSSQFMPMPGGLNSQYYFNPYTYPFRKFMHRS